MNKVLFEVNNIISTKLNQSNKSCLYFLEIWNLVHIKALKTAYYLHLSILLFPFFLKLKYLNIMFQNCFKNQIVANGTYIRKQSQKFIT